MWRRLIRSGIVSLGMLAAASLPVAAARALVLSPDEMLRVEEVYGQPGTASIALRVTFYHGASSPVSHLVPATVDAAFDAYPTLILDPDTGRPLLIWSRHNGTDYDIVFSRLDRSGWTEPITLVATPADDLRPQAQAAFGHGIHLLWTHPGGGTGFGYGLFRTDTGEAVRPPERGALGRSDPGSPGSTEGTVDDPGLNPYAPPPASDTCTGMCRGGGGSGGTGGPESVGAGCDSLTGICKGDTEPPAARAVCDALAVIRQEATGRICLWSRDDGGWTRGACVRSQDKIAVRDLRAAFTEMSARCAP
jgi:hypothetical protein